MRSSLFAHIGKDAKPARLVATLGTKQSKGLVRLPSLASFGHEHRLLANGHLAWSRPWSFIGSVTVRRPNRARPSPRRPIHQFPVHPQRRHLPSNHQPAPSTRPPTSPQGEEQACEYDQGIRRPPRRLGRLSWQGGRRLELDRSGLEASCGMMSSAWSYLWLPASVADRPRLTGAPSQPVVENLG